MLNRFTSADAAQLLQSHQLDEQAIARRLADANGNMHHLLQPAQTEITSQLPPTSTDDKPYTKPVIAAGVLVVLAVLLWWLMSEPAKTNKPIAAAAAVKPITPAALQPAVTAQPPAEQVTPIATESDLGSSGLDETAEQLMPEQIVEADKPEQLEVDATEVVDPLQHNQPKVSAEQTGEADVGSDSDPLAIAAGEQQYQLDEISLLQTEREAFAVQLAVLSSEAAYQRFKATYPALPVKAYQRNWQGQTQLVLLLVSFADKDTARAQIKQLPAALRATGPFIKSMQAVQTEIKVRQSDTE